MRLHLHFFKGSRDERLVISTFFTIAGVVVAVVGLVLWLLSLWR